MKKSIFILIAVFFAVPAIADNFDILKNDLAKADCSYFEFITVVESDIFDIVDSTFGEAYLAADGRYFIKAGEEEYLFDNNHLYTYVKENNQVIIERSDSLSNENVLFIKKLDEFYKSYILSPDLRYRLVKKEDIKGDFPDSLIVELVEMKKQLKQISYFDVNEELNRIIFIKQEITTNCVESKFEPNYPDSVEKVKL